MRNILVLLLELILLILLLGLYIAFLPQSFDTSYLSKILLVVLLLLVIYSFRKKRQVMNGKYITITHLFLLSFIIVQFQLYLDYTLSLRDQLNFLYSLDYNIVPKAATLSVVGLTCLLIGSTLEPIIPLNSTHKLTRNNFTPSTLTLKVFIFLLFIVFIYATPRDYFTGNYGYYSNEVGINYLQLKSNQLLQVSIWSYIIVHTIKYSNKGMSNLNILQYILSLGPFFLAITGLYSILVLIAGDRGPFIYISVMLIASYTITQKKRLNIFKILIMLYLFGYFLTFISHYRNIDSSFDFLKRIELANDYMQYTKTEGQGSVLSSTQELANSVASYHVLMMDQEVNEHLYGITIIGSIVAIIPGLGYLISTISPIEFYTTAAYITNITQTNFGTGGTALADIYLNFGVIGVLLIFILFGFFISRIDFKAYHSYSNMGLFTQILFMLYLANAISLGRGTILAPLGNSTLVYIIIATSILVANFKNRK